MNFGYSVAVTMQRKTGKSSGKMAEKLRNQNFCAENIRIKIDLFFCKKIFFPAFFSEKIRFFSIQHWTKSGSRVIML